MRRGSKIESLSVSIGMYTVIVQVVRRGRRDNEIAARGCPPVSHEASHLIQLHCSTPLHRLQWTSLRTVYPLCA